MSGMEPQDKLYSFQTPQTQNRFSFVYTPSPIPPSTFYASLPSSSSTNPAARSPLASVSQLHSQSAPDVLSTQSNSRTKSRKRSAREKENDEELHIVHTFTPTTSPRAFKKPKKAGRSPAQKLDAYWRYLRDVNWTLGEHLSMLFSWDGVHRSHAHAASVEQYLSGRCTHHPGELIRSWLNSPDGRIGDNEEAQSQMWSLVEPKYWHIKHARASLTSFAAQTCVEHAVKQARAAVKPDAGLHTLITLQKGSSKAGMKAEWTDIGSTTVPRVSTVCRMNQPFLWGFLSHIASGNHKAVAIRKTRPIDTVVTHVIANLNFCHNRRANWLPLARGLLYFAFSAPVDLFAYESRISSMPSYSTIYKMLKGLAEQEAELARQVGQDPEKWGVLRLDNVQNYLRQRDMRIGRENKMTVGLAATYYEIDEDQYNLCASDLDDHRTRVSDNKRKNLDVDFFVNLLNPSHLEIVGALQWLQTLVHYVPELSHYKQHIVTLYKTRAAITRLPPRASKVHPLATSGKVETVTSELKDALLDFLAQVGQTRDSHLRRLIPIGGDGLTYQKILELKNYLQLHTNEFRSLVMVEPLLEWWHTMATDVSRIYETHWGSVLSKDPSTLGHSARKIGRDEIANLKKIDFYPGIQLAYLVLDVRMLDCWRLQLDTKDLFKHFRDAALTNTLPAFEDLEKQAIYLYRNYSTTRAYHYAMNDADCTDTSEWVRTIPRGSNWKENITEDNLNDVGLPVPIPTSRAARLAKTKAAKPKKKTKAQQAAEEEETESLKHADHVLAHSISFMRDTLLSREAANAVVDGDVGRFWEVLKVMLFTFAGSSHSKYASYLLETITSLELEASCELRDAILRMMLVNLAGTEGGFAPGDLIQEFFNRMLEMVVERKGKEFDHTFIRTVVSRNLHHLCRIKKDLREGIGLAGHAGTHSEPHTRPEVKTLLHQYAYHELHSRRPGRIVDRRETDNFRDGWKKLRKSKLSKWIQETTRVRIREDIAQRIAGLSENAVAMVAGNQPELDVSGPDEDNTSDSDSEESDYGSGSADEDEDETSGFQHTLGVMEMVDGELVVGTLSTEEIMQEILRSFEVNEDSNSDATETEEETDSDSIIDD